MARGVVAFRAIARARHRGEDLMADERSTPLALPHDAPLAGDLVRAIRAGDLPALGRLLREQPGLATARIVDRKGGGRTPLHVAADWPGFFPNGGAVVRTLLAAGADPDAGKVPETPLHWVASSDDLEVADALLAGGADLEVRGGSIADGTPLANAVGYGCWQVARRLLQAGARVEHLWQAAALGLTSQVEAFFAAPTPPTPDQIDAAFWQACHGGQRRTAEYLHGRGADLRAIPDYAKASPLEIAGSPDTGRQALIAWLRDVGAGPSRERAG
jgi:uncharacterized protein